MIPRVEVGPYNPGSTQYLTTHTESEASLGRVHVMPFWIQGKLELSRVTAYLGATGLAAPDVLMASFALYRVPNWRQGGRGAAGGLPVEPFLEFEYVAGLGTGQFEVAANGEGSGEHNFDVAPSRWISTENCPYAIGWQVSDHRVGFRHSYPVSETAAALGYRTQHEPASFGRFPRRLVAYSATAPRPYISLRSPWGVRLFPTWSEGGQ